MYNGSSYHSNTYYDKTFITNGSHNGRPIFHFLNKATIKWEKFTLGSIDQMAWVVAILGDTYSVNNVRFVSFSDVDEPKLAINWKHRNDKMDLIDAPTFNLD